MLSHWYFRKYIPYNLRVVSKKLEGPSSDLNILKLYERSILKIDHFIFTDIGDFLYIFCFVFFLRILLK